MLSVPCAVIVHPVHFPLCIFVLSQVLHIDLESFLLDVSNGVALVDVTIGATMRLFVTETEPAETCLALVALNVVTPTILLDQSPALRTRLAILQDI